MFDNGKKLGEMEDDAEVEEVFRILRARAKEYRDDRRSSDDRTYEQKVLDDIEEVITNIFAADTIDIISRVCNEEPWLMEATAWQWNHLQRDNEYALEKIKYEMLEYTFCMYKEQLHKCTIPRDTEINECMKETLWMPVYDNMGPDIMTLTDHILEEAEKACNEYGGSVEEIIKRFWQEELKDMLENITLTVPCIAYDLDNEKKEII